MKFKCVCVNCNKEFETEKKYGWCGFVCLTEWLKQQYLTPRDAKEMKLYK